MSDVVIAEKAVISGVVGDGLPESEDVGEDAFAASSSVCWVTLGSVVAVAVTVVVAVAAGARSGVAVGCRAMIVDAGVSVDTVAPALTPRGLPFKLPSAHPTQINRPTSTMTGSFIHLNLLIIPSHTIIDCES